jgi:drug/metabolite transporter (DMT)-like permease
MTPPSRGAALVLMVVAPFLWSTAGVVTRYMQTATPLEQAFWRSAFAGIFVAAVMLFTGKRIRLHGTLVFSAAMWATMFTVFVVALSLTTIANTLVVMSVGPLLTALLARLFLKDPLPPSAWVAAFAACAGIAWMFAGGFAMHSPRDIAGMLVALVVPLAGAANLIALRRSDAGVDFVPALVLGALLSCLVALPFAVPFRATGRDIALLGFLGVFQLALPCILMVVATRTLLAPEVALIGLLEVILGPLWAWLGVGEVPARSTVIGGAIVLGAMVLYELAALRGRLGKQVQTSPS